MKQRTHPKCWYRPVAEAAQARQALRFTLSEAVTAAIPPGDEALYRMALDMAGDLPPVTPEERVQLLSGAEGLTPIFKV